ncbi:unnamed protein product [Echinostoma caproni]|uniref:LXG domain-containing protein n=1 Tax=Echinostoma caproni TaxID=27848 RepID=A0A183AVZ1_9TREM|nr:unnamed protein product [Echinostoma caproni]
MDYNEEGAIIPELLASEQRITKIKSEIDKFEQVYNRVSNGFGNTKLLNDEYHAVIVSTRDLSTHLANLQKFLLELKALDENLNHHYSSIVQRNTVKRSTLIAAKLIMRIG